jgi:hypothetical protein
MNMSDFRPAGQFASVLGAKSLVYGAPGTGKTPLVNTAPRPVLMACEPGLLSMRGSKVPTWIAATPKAINDFFDWLLKSTEVKNFDTVCVDSLSEMASIFLRDALGKNSSSGNKAHGQLAYGKMADCMIPHLNTLFHMPQKHTYLICKQDTFDGVMRPSFPGKFLPTYIPHLYDVVMHLAVHNIPGAGQHKAFRTSASFDAVARDRSGNLAEFEPLDLTAIFNKVMS